MPQTAQQQGTLQKITLQPNYRVQEDTKNPETSHHRRTDNRRGSPLSIQRQSKNFQFLYPP